MLPRSLLSLGFIASTLLLTACNKQDEAADEASTAVAIEETVMAVDTEAEIDAQPILVSSAAMVTTAKVQAVDMETRAVTLLSDEDGAEPFTIIADEEAHNLDQVEVGDTITAEYVETLTVEIVKVEEGTEPAAADIIAASRAEKGETPAGGMMEAQIVVAIVEDIDLENNTFKLKGPDNEVREYTAENPDNLTLAEVGDAVVITMTESIAVALTEKANAAAEE